MEEITRFVYTVNDMTSIMVFGPASKIDMGKVRFDANKIHNQNVKNIEEVLQAELADVDKLTLKRKNVIEKTLKSLVGRRSPSKYDIKHIVDILEY